MRFQAEPDSHGKHMLPHLHSWKYRHHQYCTLQRQACVNMYGKCLDHNTRSACIHARSNPRMQKRVTHHSMYHKPHARPWRDPRLESASPPKYLAKYIATRTGPVLTHNVLFVILDSPHVTVLTQLQCAVPAYALMPCRATHN